MPDLEVDPADIEFLVQDLDAGRHYGYSEEAILDMLESRYSVVWS